MSIARIGISLPPLSNKHEQKISKANTGVPKTNEHRQNLSISAKNRPKRITTNGTKQKISISRKGRKRQIDSITGIITYRYTIDIN